MIDEELYKIATEELNSDNRRADVWARACALASDDHDEARFLYTNLRVEEMLNKEGKKRTFSTTRDAKNEDLSSAENLDTLELTMDDSAAPAPASRPTGISDSTAPLPIDDLLGYDADDTNAPSSTAGNAQDSTAEKSIENDDTWLELDSLAASNASGSAALSNLTGNAVENNQAKEADDNVLGDFIESDDIDAQTGSLNPDQQTPEKQNAAQLSDDLERQVADMMSRTDVVSSTNNASTQHDEGAVDIQHGASMQQLPEEAAHAQLSGGIASSKKDTATTQMNPQDTVRPDYADSDILDEDLTLDLDADLDTGVGRSFMVFSRGGALKAIKRGVSWPALLFTFPWLLSKAMFGTALIYGCLWLVTLAGLYVTANQWMATSTDATLAIKLWTLGFGLLALIGLLYIPFRYANSWLSDKLQNRGFEFESAVSARNKREAVERLLSHSD